MYFFHPSQKYCFAIWCGCDLKLADRISSLVSFRALTQIANETTSERDHRKWIPPRIGCSMTQETVGNTVTTQDDMTAKSDIFATRSSSQYAESTLEGVRSWKRFSWMFSGEFPFQLGQHGSYCIGPMACGIFRKHSTKPFPQPDAPLSRFWVDIIGLGNLWNESIQCNNCHVHMLSFQAKHVE